MPIAFLEVSDMTVAEHAAAITAPDRVPHDAPLTVDGAVPADLDGALVCASAHPAGTRAGDAAHASRPALVYGVRLGGGAARRLIPAAADLTGVHAGDLPLLPFPAPGWMREGNLAVCGETHDAPSQGAHDTHAAHLAAPVRDHAGGEWHTVAVRPGSDVAEHLVLGPGGEVRDVRPFALPGAPLLHAVALTERFVVVFDLPVVHSRAAALMGSSSPYRWRPGRPARIGLLRRDAWDPSGPRWFPIDPCYVFEAVNAYEDRGRRVVVDAVRHARAFDTPVGDLGRDAEPASVHRWTLDLATGTTSARALIGSAAEASADPRSAGRRHQLVFARAAGGQAVVGLDLAAGVTQVRELGPGRRAGRPVFVPRPGAVEGDGWIMVLTRDLARRRGELLVLDAHNLAGRPEAVVHLPGAFPDARRTAWLGAS
ncbi:carotenoid oxygenase family protein [Sphaerisporangium dianthi]|uniref:Dioxygenase n=1 Tax=Sphaerisporangium dianthi TaxID=1436120 RepID=A0ABV9CRV6_9ACTN